MGEGPGSRTEGPVGAFLREARAEPVSQAPQLVVVTEQEGGLCKSTGRIHQPVSAPQSMPFKI